MGNVVGHVTDNKGGTVCLFTAKGTYTVNRNGTGTMTLDLSTSTTGCSASTSQAVSVLFQMGNGAAFVGINGGAGLGMLTKQ